MKIRVLADDVINKIAAGEVVDRPVSVVRELVDNALDAGSSQIEVIISNGGQSLIAVNDNGCGMSRDDAVLAFERHATSKLKNADDLERLLTRGFRGEALAAISAVAKVRLVTRQMPEEAGVEVFMDGGKLRDVKPVAASPGTRIEVRHLFFNTPARRKFLRSPKVETLKIREWLSQIAVVHPGVAFRLTVDDKEELFLEPCASTVDRARTFIGEVGAAVGCEVNHVKAAGLLAHPGHAGDEVGGLAIFVNSRLVNDRLVARAAKEAFGSSLKEREFPVGYLSIGVSPDTVDVNVHPQKTEVRFKNSQAVFDAVYSAVKSALSEFRRPVSSLPGGWNSPVPTSNTAEVRQLSPREPTSLPLEISEVRNTAPVYSLGDQPASQPRQEAFKFSTLRFVGQIFGCYLLCERQDELVVVDMHAAHERINFNRIRARLSFRSDHDLPQQQLLQPEEIYLSPLENESFGSVAEALTGAGFGVTWDEAARLVRVSAVPGFWGNAALSPFIREICSVMSDGAWGRGPLERRIDDIAARLACHASIRSGNVLKPEEVYALFAALDDEACSAACPHGRPVVVTFSEMEVEKWFGRDK